MKRSVGSLEEDKDELGNLDDPTKKKCKSDAIITQTDINNFYLAIVKCDVESFDKILSKVDEIGISRKTINEWVFKQTRLRLDDARYHRRRGIFNEMARDQYKTQDVKLMKWIVDRFAKNDGGILKSASNCFMSIIFAILFERTDDPSSHSYAFRASFDIIVKAADMIHIINILQKDCGCCFLNEDYHEMFVAIRFGSDWDIANVDDYFKILRVLNVEKVEIGDISLDTYNYTLPWATTHLNRVTEEWNFNYNYVEFFFAPLIENGARMWPLTEVFRESTLMTFNDHDEFTDRCIKNVIKEYWNAIFEDTDKWSRFLDINGKGDILRKEMNDKNDNPQTHIGVNWHRTYNLKGTDSSDRFRKAIKFCKGILLAKKKYYQTRRTGIIFLMGTHYTVGKNSSIHKFVNSRMYDQNLMKMIFEFAGLFPFQPRYT